MLDPVLSRAWNAAADSSLLGLAQLLRQTLSYDDLPVHSLPLALPTAANSWNLEQPVTRVVSFPISSPAVAVQSYKFHAVPAKTKPITPKQLQPRVKLAEVPSSQQAEVLLNDEEVALPDLPDCEDTYAEVSAEQEPEVVVPSASSPSIARCDTLDEQSTDPEAVTGTFADVNADDSKQQQIPTGETYTRLNPPGDLVKLEDRLFYLLQPALETLLVEQDLHFPFHPFPYQMQGVAFLFPRVSAMLADEMGLGKTMQAITGIRLLIHSGNISNVLLVCPKPLVSNWQREFALWAPELPIAIIEGDAAKRQWQWENADCPVKIANYESLCRDKDLVCDGKHQFDLVVLDESQRIKNKSSTTAQVVRSLTRTRSWALTGTPVENSPDDLLGIFEFVAPGQLSKEMKPKALGKAAGDYILRRTKDLVLTEMPPKLYRDANLELSPEQAETYRRAEDEGVLQLSDMGESATIQHVFELVLRLKQICNVDPVTGASAKIDRLEADMEEIAASGHKAILFSQWVKTLDVLKERLGRFGILEYHGRIPHRQREGVIQQFKEDPSKHMILMSYGAGSVGLNLQFCRYVFLFDRWWNPAVEDQAINRAHRIGAAGTVTVTRFISVNTIEERINQVLEEKRELFDTILGGAEGKQTLGLSAQQIFGLFKLKCPTGPVRYAA
jgi:SNF2 family DNA or RNA helicase